MDEGDGRVGIDEGRCTGCTDHRRHALATFRTQRVHKAPKYTVPASTPAKHRRLQSALLAVMYIPRNCYPELVRSAIIRYKTNVRKVCRNEENYESGTAVE